MPEQVTERPISNKQDEKVAAQGVSSEASFDLELAAPTDVATGYEYAESKISNTKKKVPSFDQVQFDNPVNTGPMPQTGGPGTLGGGY